MTLLILLYVVLAGYYLGSTYSGRGFMKKLLGVTIHDDRCEEVACSYE